MVVHSGDIRKELGWSIPVQIAGVARNMVESPIAVHDFPRKEAAEADYECRFWIVSMGGRTADLFCLPFFCPIGHGVTP